jgi:hypothetical protein
MRKNGGMSFKIEGEEDGSEPRYVRRSKGEKRGVLFCGVHPDDHQSVIVGFSLCNKMDDFDVVNGERRKGFGLGIAKERALKWTNHTDFFVQLSCTEDAIMDFSKPLMRIDNPNSDEVVEIPPSVVKPLHAFIERCQRYYQDKDFPVWVQNFKEGLPYNGTMNTVEYRPAFENEDEVRFLA